MLKQKTINPQQEGRVIMSLLRVALVAVAASQVYGCASIVGSSSQPISVQAMKSGAQVSGATCELKNDKGSWYVTTPGSVTVHKAFGDMSVKCQNDSNDAAITTAKSSANGLVFGNILFGGLIGLAVDMGTGSGYDYPSIVTVLMDSMPTPRPANASAASSGPAAASVASLQPAATPPQAASIESK